MVPAIQVQIVVMNNIIYFSGDIGRCLVPWCKHDVYSKRQWLWSWQYPTISESGLFNTENVSFAQGFIIGWSWKKLVNQQHRGETSIVVAATTFTQSDSDCEAGNILQ